MPSNVIKTTWGVVNLCKKIFCKKNRVFEACIYCQELKLLNKSQDEPQIQKINLDEAEDNDKENELKGIAR